MNRPNVVTLKFPPEDDTFFSDLRSEIRAYFQSTGQTVYGNSAMYLKVVGLVVVYLGAYGLTWWLSPNSWWVVANYAFLGVWSVFLGVNVGHDAAHHALFKNRKFNDAAMHIFDLLGLSSFNWKNRHVSGHHVFSNIMNYDPDIQQSAVVKIFPQDKRRPFHKWQWLYMPFIYAIFIPRWVFYRDFKDVFYEYIGGFKNRQNDGIQSLLRHLSRAPSEPLDWAQFVHHVVGLWCVDDCQQCDHCGGPAHHTHARGLRISRS